MADERPEFPAASAAVTPTGVPVEAHSTGPEPPEHARAIALARARAILAAAVLAEAAGIQAALSIVEHFAHRGRIPARALLMERPLTPEGAGRLERLHAAVGCPRQPPEAVPSKALGRALTRLPWSGEWLLHVVRGLPADGAARVSPVAASWVEARNTFVEAHGGLVAHIVRRFAAGSPGARDDLMQEGRLGLCRAVERYDPSRGTRFSSYAVPVIRHAMAQYLQRMGPGPSAPRLAVPTVEATPPSSTRLTSEAGRRRRSIQLVSLDAPLDDGGSLAERLVDPERLGPDLAAARALDRERLRDGLRALPGEVAEIVRLHWGLDGAAPRSVLAVARHIGRPSAEVEALIRDALHVLRGVITTSPRRHRRTAAQGRPVPADPRRAGGSPVQRGPGSRG